MEAIGHLIGGFGVAFQPLNLAVVFIGVLLGTVVGMLPGIGPINAIAILVPVIFVSGMPPASALILLAGIYYGSQFGNSISTILLNVPGTASAVVTAIDGYAMTRRGRAGPALALSAIASFVGGTVSIFGLVFLAPGLARLAISFGPAEYCALMVFAFVALSTLSGPDLPRGFVALGMGVLLASVGFDPNSAVPRFTFGSLRLLDGLDFVVVTIGLFAVSEVFLALDGDHPNSQRVVPVRRATIDWRDVWRTRWTMVRTSVVGFVVGILPGAGGTIASFLAYSTERQLAGREHDFGNGDPRGVAAPETANNAAATGAMIPLLTLGVPGSATTAVLLGALMGMDVTPGPLFLERHGEVFWGLAASMYVGNVMLLALNLPLVGIFVRVLQVPRALLMPSVAALSLVAVYAVNRSTLDLFLTVGFGVLGYIFRKLQIPLAPIILGLVLGPLLERNLRRALALGGGDWRVFVASPISIVLWTLTVLSVGVPMITAVRRWWVGR